MPDDWLDEFYNGPIFPEAPQPSRAVASRANGSYACLRQAPEVKLLLDTCTFLWITDEAQSLPSRVVALYRSPENQVYLSAASAMEIATKYSTKRMLLSEPPAAWLPRQRAAHGIEALPVDEESALHVSVLPFDSSDPFDRLLVAQAIVHGHDDPDVRPFHYPVSGPHNVVMA